MDKVPIRISLGIDKLVDTISNATGLTAYGIRKNADAESYAAIKKAETETEVKLLRLQGEEKIAQYLLTRNQQKVNNVEGVIFNAKQQFAPNEIVSEEPVEKDWMNRFLNIAEDISDEDMQVIWGRVLAGEIKKPKSFSLRTLEVLRNMSKEEAFLLMRTSCFEILNDQLCTEPYGLSLVDQITLEDIGIVCGEELINSFTVSANGICSFVLNRNTRINIYAPKGLLLKFKGKKLSKAGKEILNLIIESNNVNFYSKLSNYIKTKGATKVTINKIVKWNGEQYEYQRIETEI